MYGFLGACRSDEIYNAKMEHISKMVGSKDDQIFLIDVPDNKTNNPRAFTVSGEFFDIFDRYISLRPEDVTTNRFFLNYQNGRCTKQVIGINKISKNASRVAKFLGIPQTDNVKNKKIRKNFTGHALRRTSASTAANNGADLARVKALGGWESGKVAESYVENSILYKQQTEQILTARFKKNKTTSTVTRPEQIPEMQVNNDHDEESYENFSSVEELQIIDDTSRDQPFEDFLEDNPASHFEPAGNNIEGLLQTRNEQADVTLLNNSQIHIEDEMENVIFVNDNNEIILNLPVIDEPPKQPFQMISNPPAAKKKRIDSSATEFLKGLTFNHCQNITINFH